VGVLSFIGVFSGDGCITKAPSDALRSALSSQSAGSQLADWSTVDLGLFFTLGVKPVDVPGHGPLSARSPATTPRPASSSRARVSNQCMSRVSLSLSQPQQPIVSPDDTLQFCLSNVKPQSLQHIARV